MDLFRTKKIMHPLRKKKPTKPLGTTRNHVTSQDKKKSHNLSAQNKTMQPLGTKKIMQPIRKEGDLVKKIDKKSK